MFQVSTLAVFVFASLLVACASDGERAFCEPVQLTPGEVAASMATSCPHAVELDGHAYLLGCRAAVRDKYLGRVLGSGADVNDDYVVRRIRGVPVEDALAVEVRYRQTGALYDKAQCGQWMLGLAERLPEETADAVREEFTFDPTAETID